MNARASTAPWKPTGASRRQIEVMQGAQVVETFRRELPTSKVLDHDFRNT